MTVFGGKTAIVTGGASSMGRATVRKFAWCGANVVIGDLSTESGEVLAREIVDAGGGAVFVRCDVTREDDVARLVSATIDRFGRLDMAANMASVPQSGGMFCSTQARDRTFAINLIVPSCVSPRKSAR